MEINYYRNYEGITKNEAIQMLGKKRFDRFLKEAVADFMEDPNTALEYPMGSWRFIIEISI
jgi:hypothetical protein